MLNKIGEFIEFIFKIAKWIIMLLFIIFVFILFRSCSNTMDAMDSARENVKTTTTTTPVSPSLNSKEVVKNTCKIESWNYKQFTASSIKVDGVTTCMNGRLIIKLYDENQQYIGNKTTYIKGGAFNTYVDGVAPSTLNIKYSISN